MYRQKFALVSIGVGSLVGVACAADDGSNYASESATTQATVFLASDPPTTAAPATVSSTGAPTTAAPTTTSTALGSDALFPDGLRNVRYCEVLLLTKPADEFIAEVWSTIGYSDCPQSDWEALDAARIATERGAIAAILNGPRYWTLVVIVSDIRDTAPTTVFGSIEMFSAATTNLGATIPDQSPFVERVIARDTVFGFRAGSQIYELTDPTGKRYVMQSYSLKLNPAQTIESLASLGSVLQLPAGWAFTTQVLTDDLDVLSNADGNATVIQDEFQNTYQLIE